MLIKQGRISFT